MTVLTDRPCGPRRRTPMITALLAAAVMAIAACGRDNQSLVGYELDPAPQVGDLSLEDVLRGGAPSPLRADSHELLIVYLGYTNCPDVCPTAMASVRAMLERLGDDDAARVEVAMVTVDPAHDTPGVLADWVRQFIPSGRALRTDDPNTLRTVAERLLASSGIEDEVTASSAPVDDAAHEPVRVAHTSHLYVLDDTGESVLVWPEDVGVDDMASDIRILLDRRPANT